MNRVSLPNQRGAITYWKLGGLTEPEPLANAFQQLGLPHRPVARTWQQALKSALADVKNRNQLVRPLQDKDKNGYTLVTEERGSRVNDYDCDVSVAIDDDGWIQVHCGVIDESALRDKTRYYKRLLAARSVTDTLVDILVKTCDGIALRPNGGVYFVPHQHVALWRSVCEAVAKAGNDNHLTVAELEINHDTLRDIRNAITEEIDQFAAECEKLAEDGTAGKRAVENRTKQAMDMINRIERYEEFLDETLGQCRSHVNRIAGSLEQALATATAAQEPVVI